MTKIVRFDHAGVPRFGAVDGDAVEILSAAPWLGGTPVGERLPLSALSLLAPVEPSKIVCVGRNYAAHAKELGNEVPKEPLLFLKPPSSVIGPGAAIVRPSLSEDVQYEAELALVIGKRCRNVSEADVPAHVAGITCLNDVTARDIQRRETHLTRSKSFDTFCPIGPWVVLGLPTEFLQVRARVNGETRQDGNTRDMIFSPAALVAFVSRMMTLEPGDVISTGTPAGVGSMVAGDVVQIDVEGIGVLENPVVDEG